MSYLNFLIQEFTLNIPVFIKARVSRVITFFFAVILSTFLTIGAMTVARAAADVIPNLLPTITATKADTFVGGDGDGKADPGETIRYTTVISNSGTDATGVTFNDIIDANTTLVAGTVNVSPLAINDSYDTVGNTLLDVSSIVPASPTVHVAGSLFTNDVEFLGDTFDVTHTHITSHSNPANGTLTLDNNTGTFTYLPSANFTGIDSFTYTLTDSAGLTDTATVTINVLGRVWYVKNDAAAGGLGRSSDPFDTLLEAQTASSASDTIYIFQGNGTNSGQNTGIILKDGQRLLGEGVALTVPVSINGGSNPTTLRTAGTFPIIGNGAGDGVSLSTVSIGASFTGVEIRGLDISGTGNAIDVTTNSTFGGSFELANNVINATTAEGIDINGGGSSALTISLHDNTITSNGNGIDIQRTAGSITVTTFDDNVVSGNTGGSGINIVGTGASILFDAIPGTAAFDVVSGGTTAIGQSGNSVGAAGLTLSNIRGDISFTDLDIYANSGAALFVNGTSPNYTGTSGTRVTVNTNAPTLAASAGAAADITDANITLVLNTMSSSNSATTGVSLTRVGGTFTAPSGSSITNATGADFSINGGNNANANVTVTYPGTITDDIGTLIQIQNVTATSTHAFSGAITDGNDGDGSGISLTSNTGATINFTGALTLSTGANTAFNAAGGGTISATNTTSTVTTTNATAVNVVNTTIGASNLTFRSISSSGGSATGIILTNTGSTGSLVVAGDGTTTKGGNGSGGTITNKTGGADGSGSISSGVYINNGSAILRNMTLTRFDNYGVYGLGINNVTVQYSTVGAISGTACADTDGDIGTGSGSGDAALVFGITNPSGSNGFSSGGSLLLDNLRVFCSIEHQVEIYQQSGIFTATISNSDIKDASPSLGGDGVQVEMQGTANGTVIVDTVSFDDNKSQAVQGAANDSSTLDMTVKNSTLVRSSQGNEGILLSNGSNGDLIAHVTGNNISGIPGANIFVGQTPGNASASSSLTAYIANNIIDHPTSAVNSAILVWTTSTIGAGAPANVMVTNNVITQNSTGGASRGIFVDTPDANTNPNFSVTVSGNTVNVMDGNLGMNGIAVQGRQVSSACFDVRNNTVNFPLGNVAGILGIRIRQADTAVVNLEQGSSAGAAAAVLAANNTATTESFGTVNVVGNSTCANPPVSFSPNRTGAIAQAQLKASIDTQTMISLAPVSIEKTVSNGTPGSVMKYDFPARSTTANVSANPDGGKPLFALMQPALAFSGETIGPISIGTLPAGKSITITYNVTVDSPQPDGKTQILNQSTISGSNFSNVLTTDAGPADCVNGTKTCTPVDRPDTTASSINRQTPSTTPTNATSVVWRVTFANAVSGLTSSNFTLTNTGLTAPSITTVSAVTASPDTQWDVTVNTGTGNGTLGLNMTSDVGLSHDVTNLTSTGQTYTIDKTAPTVTNVTSSTADGAYNASDAISIQITFSEIVTITGTPQLTLETGATDQAVDYTSGSGTNTLTFTYTVQTGDTSSDLDYFSTSALTLNAGTIQDASTNNANLTLASPSTAGSLGNNKAIVIDTNAPTTTSFTRFNPATSPTSADTLIFRATFSESLSGVDTTDFSVNGTTTATVTGISPISASLYEVTVSGGDLAAFNDTVGLNFSGVMNITDLAGNALANTEPSTDEIYTVDNNGPTITNVTSTASNGAYTTGAVIPVTITFSESVTVTGTPQLTLETGAADAVVNYTSGNGTATLTFNYTVTAGHTSADLDYVGTGSLALNSGTIKDGVSTDATLTLPAPGTPGSLGANKNIVIDTTAPSAPVVQAPANSSNTNDSTPTVTGTAEANSTVNVIVDGSPAGTTSANGTGDWSFILGSILIEGSHTVRATTTDAAGNTSVDSNTNTFTVDTTAPDTNITANPTNPTHSASASFSFTGNDGSGSGITGFQCKLDGGSFTACTTPQNYTGLSDGSHTFQVRASDATGNMDATPASYTWIVDTTSPTVVVSSAATSSTNVSPIIVTITFSEAVTGFTPSVAAGDIVIGGVGGVDSNPQTVSGAVYTFELTPSAQGTITIQVPSGSTSDAATNSNSISNIFNITYDTVAPTVTINQKLSAPAQSDPANSSPINFTVDFSESVTGFTEADVTLSGSANPTTAIVTGSGTTYNVAVSGMTASGTVIASIPSTVAQDAAANNNNASTSTDNTVSFIFDSTLPTVISSVRADPNPASTASVDFTVTFSEPVTGVDTSDFTLTYSGVATATVSGVSGTGSVYTVSVNTGTGNGSIRLDVLDDNTIVDAALNPLSAGFTGGESYTIINRSAIFVDVPHNYWANGHIERLYNAGITSGCSANPLNYCPDVEVTRAQMAVFILKGIHGSSYTPPNATGTVFNDIPVNYWAAAWIEQIAAEGITSGCGNGNYCPDQTLTTRAQMAIFLLKARYGASYTPPPASGNFNDVPANYWAAAWIEQLAAEGITNGCGNGNYCPESPLTRAQIAVFLVRTFNLP